MKSSNQIAHRSRNLSYFAPYVKTLGQSAFKAARSYVGSKRARTSTNANERSSSEPVTFQGDVRRDYVGRRSKRPSRRVLRRSRKFTRRVMKICDKQLSPIKVMFQVNSGVRVTPQGGQDTCLVGDFFLGTLNNVGQANERDFFRMATGLGDSSTSQSNLRLGSAMIEVACAASPGNAGLMYLEVYTVKCRKLVTFPSGSASLSAFYSDGWLREPNALTGVSAANLSNSAYGASPFHNRSFCEMFNIIKKETISLSPGSCINLTLKAHMPRVWNFDRAGTSTLTFGGKHTIGYIIIAYGSPQTVVTNAGAPISCNWTYNVVRTYNLVNVRSAGTAASAQSIAP